MAQSFTVVLKKGQYEYNKNNQTDTSSIMVTRNRHIIWLDGEEDNIF